MAKVGKLGIFLGLLALALLLVQVDSFSHVRGTLTDKLYGGNAVLDSIVIVAIDDASINSIGHWPWSRDVHANLLEKLNDAKVIGIDVSFFEPSPNDVLLNTTLQSMDNVVLASEIQQGVTYLPIFPSITGYVNLLGDADGITRRVNPSIANDMKPFSFAIAEQAGYATPTEKETLLINFADAPHSFKTVSVNDVLAKNLSFANKIVLIGATAPNLHDDYFVPTSDGKAMPGVEIHANILQNIINNDFLRAPDKLIVMLGVILAALAGMFLIARLKYYYAIPLAIGLLVVYAIVAIISFNQFNLLIDLFFAPLAFAVFTGAGVSVAYTEEKTKGAYLRDAFSKYVSKELLDEILSKNQQLTLGGEKRILTVMFSDIRDFTSISEKLSPEELVHLLNEYLTTMTRIVLKHQGTVDKFIGDAIMALWNAPLLDDAHAVKACDTAVEQIKALRELQANWKQRNVPSLNIGIGIHTGPAVVGNMGSEERFDYTAIGDTVNLASRMEGLTKEYGVSILISESTYEHIKGKYLCRKLDAVKVKGKKVPVLLYHLCVDQDQAFVTSFEKALELYFKAKFHDALKGFKETAKIRPNDPSCALFIERCELYLKHPPAKDWDGAFVYEKK